MLIKFESGQSSSFVMQEDIAQALLRLMDRDTPEGAVTDGEIQDALQRLDDALQRLARAEREPESIDDEDDSEQPDSSVELQTRAAPLLDMLRRASKEDGYVMWRPD